MEPSLFPPWVVFADRGKPLKIMPAGRPGDVADVSHMTPEEVRDIVRTANKLYDLMVRHKFALIERVLDAIRLEIDRGVQLTPESIGPCTMEGHEPHCGGCCVEEQNRLHLQIDRLEHAAEGWEDEEDQPLAEDHAIAAAFPTRSERHETYAEAMRLVGAKRSKLALVSLVNWILTRAEVAEDKLDVVLARCEDHETNVIPTKTKLVEDLRVELKDLEEERARLATLVAAYRTAIDQALARDGVLTEAGEEFFGIIVTAADSTIA